ncbi:cysteine hydrolase family protein [Polaribacter staleyi]|uniref:cysteine hydrolase family protein n=1 Tax=Polaribacter staleyi TaxID=2022337 RepID=UPI0031B9F5CB
MKKATTFVFFIVWIFTLKAQVKNMKTALVLIDIQNDYFKGGKMELNKPLKAGQNAQLILKNFRSKKMPVIHIQHFSTRPNSTFFIPNTFGNEIHESVKPIKNEKIITKNYPNSFRETELLYSLREIGIKKLVICGMMTHMCVDATTRAAKDFGFECIVISDACATKDIEINNEIVKAEEVQKAFLGALNYYYSTVLTTERFLCN